MDLFSFQQSEQPQARLLADRMRPETLDEYIGQEHIVGTGKLLRRAIEGDQVSSILFYGPPGCGKTTLAILSPRRQKAYLSGLMLSTLQSRMCARRLSRPNRIKRCTGARRFCFWMRYTASIRRARMRFSLLSSRVLLSLSARRRRTRSIMSMERFCPGQPCFSLSR